MDINGYKCRFLAGNIIETCRIFQQTITKYHQFFKLWVRRVFSCFLHAQASNSHKYCSNGIAEQSNWPATPQEAKRNLTSANRGFRRRPIKGVDVIVPIIGLGKVKKIFKKNQQTSSLLWKMVLVRGIPLQKGNQRPLPCLMTEKQLKRQPNRGGSWMASSTNPTGNKLGSWDFSLIQNYLLIPVESCR